jgi:hypothetical protein
MRNVLATSEAIPAASHGLSKPEMRDAATPTPLAAESRDAVEAMNPRRHDDGCSPPLNPLEGQQQSVDAIIAQPPGEIYLLGIGNRIFEMPAEIFVTDDLACQIQPPQAGTD